MYGGGFQSETVKFSAASFPKALQILPLPWLSGFSPLGSVPVFHLNLLNAAAERMKTAPSVDAVDQLDVVESRLLAMERISVLFERWGVAADVAECDVINTI